MSVPTPSQNDGTCDTSIVERVIKDLAENNYTGLVAIKSTTIPGTTDKLAKYYPNMRIAHCPEFLREKAAYVDFVENHDLCVIGTYNEQDFNLIKEAHGELPKEFAQLTPLESELCKYFSNLHNALLIVFANEFYEVSRAIGANYNKIKNAMVKRRNINNVYLDANECFRGFGGNCLPKDTQAFAVFVKKLGINMQLFKTIVDENKKFKTTTL